MAAKEAAAIRGDTQSSGSLAKWVLSISALALFASLPMERIFSDGLFLIRLVEEGPSPYYNVAYVPFAYGLHGLLEPLFGWSVDTALTVVSATLMSIGVWGTIRLGQRLNIRTAPLTVSVLLLICSPCALFFGSLVEVHSMQFAGAVWAINIAWSAREKQGSAAWRCLAMAFAVAFLAHLSHAIVLPGLWLLARRSRPVASEHGPVTHGWGCQITSRGLPWIVGGVVAIGAIAAYLYSLEFAEWSHNQYVVWISALWTFGKNFVDASFDRGLFAWFEIAEYLNDELVSQAALLLPGLAIGGLAWLKLLKREAFESEAGEFVARSFPMIFPALLIFPQGGVWEHGAYYLTYYPAFTLSIAWFLDRALSAKANTKSWAAIAILLVVPQLWLSLENRAAYREGRVDARQWMAAISAQIGPGDSVITSTLARLNALEYARPDLATADFKRRMDSLPARGRSALLIEEVGLAIGPLLGEGGSTRAMWLDMDLFKRRWDSPSEDWRDELRGLLEQPGIQVDEFLTPGAEMLRIQLVR